MLSMRPEYLNIPERRSTRPVDEQRFPKQTFNRALKERQSQANKQILLNINSVEAFWSVALRFQSKSKTQKTTFLHQIPMSFEQ